jgi:hypothetical protein
MAIVKTKMGPMLEENYNALDQLDKDRMAGGVLPFFAKRCPEGGCDGICFEMTDEQYRQHYPGKSWKEIEQMIEQSGNDFICPVCGYTWTFD